MSHMATSQPPKQDERAMLSKRTIPHMELCRGQIDSKTSSIPPRPAHVDAVTRFAVSGTAIVVGGTGTLGLEACNALLEHGASGLAIFDINASQAEHQVVKLRERFPSCEIRSFQVDVTDDEAVKKAVQDVVSHLGAIEHLLCFNGIVGCVNAIDITPDQWRRILDVNTTGSFFCAQAVARQMVAQRHGGSITFIASISAHRVNYPQPQVAYNVSKAALVTLKNCLAAEWARYGIRTNTVSPGYMDTILNEGEGLAATRDVWTERNPLGRMGRPSELTGAVVLLASSAGSYMNGVDIVVDGGGLVF